MENYVGEKSRKTSQNYVGEKSFEPVSFRWMVGRWGEEVGWAGGEGLGGLGRERVWCWGGA